ncbi:Conserved_hypothetical protein [Hexamita inflata]|uniref:Uncharacterized protein n=1 Tax=Hexamita inflata TaxID=28002 RepID=A0AA86UBZ1_9EUKA|nr:Conserved hypothetical protein [Hexamita inflata]
MDELFDPCELSTIVAHSLIERMIALIELLNSRQTVTLIKTLETELHRAKIQQYCMAMIKKFGYNVTIDKDTILNLNQCLLAIQEKLYLDNIVTKPTEDQLDTINDLINRSNICFQTTINLNQSKNVNIFSLKSQINELYSQFKINDAKILHLKDEHVLQYISVTLNLQRCCWRHQNIILNQQTQNGSVTIGIEYQMQLQRKISSGMRTLLQLLNINTQTKVTTAKGIRNKYFNDQQKVQLPIQLSMVTKKFRRTYYQPISSKIYPNPPSTDEITSYTDIQFPIQYQFSKYFQQSSLQQIPSIRNHSIDYTTLKILEYPLFIKKNKDQKLLVKNQNKSYSDIFETLSEKSEVSKISKAGTQHTNNNTNCEQLVQNHIPLDVQSLTSTEYFNYTVLHWSQSQSAPLTEIYLLTNINLIKTATQQAIELQRKQVTAQQHLLHQWVDTVLKIAAKQKIQDLYAPILSSCGRYTQYLNTITGEITKIHPEIVQVQKLISQQYYELEARVKIKSDSPVLIVLQQLQLLVNERIFYDQHNSINKILFRRKMNTLNEKFEEISQSIHQYILW